MRRKLAQSKENTVSNSRLLRPGNAGGDSLRTGTAHRQTPYPTISAEVKLPNSVDEYVQRFKEALVLTNNHEQWGALWRLGISISEEDLATAKAKLHTSFASDEEGDRPRHMHAIIFAQWVESQPVAAAKWVYRLQSFPTAVALPAFGLDGENTTKLGQTWTTHDQSTLMHDVVSYWAALDLESACAWALQLPGG